jgi:hypothetical protein
MNLSDIRTCIEQSRKILMEERGRIDLAIRGLESFLSSNGAGNALPMAEDMSATIRWSKPRVLKGVGSKKPASIADKVMAMLISRGPMKTNDILAALEKQGEPVKGTRPIQTLYGILYKDSKSGSPRVRRLKSGAWMTVGEPERKYGDNL